MYGYYHYKMRKNWVVTQVLQPRQDERNRKKKRNLKCCQCGLVVKVYEFIISNNYIFMCHFVGVVFVVDARFYFHRDVNFL